MLSVSRYSRLLGNLVLEGFSERLHRVLDGLDRVGHDEAANASAADDQQLEGLVEHVEMSAHRHEAAEDTPQGNHKADNHIHDETTARINLLLH